MSPARDDDWSDSDDDVGSDVETSVLLGVPDGLVQSNADLSDAAVSRIGGHPVRAISPMYFDIEYLYLYTFQIRLFFLRVNPLSLRPSAKSVRILANFSFRCGVPLKIAQWTVLSMFGVAPSPHVRANQAAWRGLRRNDRYAAKLEAKLAKKRAAEKAKALAEQQKATPKKNPFSLNAPPSQTMFGMGIQIFGDTSTPVESSESKPDESANHEEEEEDQTDTDSADESSSEDELITAMASVTVAESFWKASPSYPPLYLSTLSEYLPPQPKPKVPPGTQITDSLDDDLKKDKDISWASEPYEDSLDMDHVFERFTKRVAYEGEQCVRYELGGTPLPFASDTIFASLFPSPPAPNLPVTKGAFTVVNTPKREYFPTNIPPCPACRGKRIFECQLMPNLINVLRRPANTQTQLTDEERRKAVERALKGASESSDDEWRMDWGTSMVFSCEKDCCFDEDGNGTRECWREEVVLVQASI
ncbi:hypothetical protein H0H93_013763 [Arthromyces matolae]|nr:hypothetical protein H0H93_013763 [Arthromyces matolae]